jgi:Protein of unknown function (DUF1569)
MALPNIFDAEITQTLIERIQKLTPTTQAVWGKMNVAQMLAHSNVTYEIAYDNIHPKPNFLMKWMLKNFIKKIVVGEKPYPKNSRTAPVFLMVIEKDFSKEKERLIQYSIKTNQLGASHFEGKENLSFGALTATEWNNLFYKHIDHHLTQFGV